MLLPLCGLRVRECTAISAAIKSRQLLESKRVWEKIRPNELRLMLLWREICTIENGHGLVFYQFIIKYKGELYMGLGFNAYTWMAE